MAGPAPTPADATPPAVRFTHVSKWYGDLQVLDDVSLSVSEGEKVVLLGPSGSGKTTLVRCINHLEAIQQGEIHVHGELVGYRLTGAGRKVPLSEAALARYRQGVGMVFQRFNLFPHLTALENVAIGPVKVLGLTPEEARASARQLLDRVGLAAKHQSYPSQLSGGQQQRVAIARMLAMKPRLLLFDEPTSALDPEMVGEVLAVMRDLSQTGISMMVVSHEMGFAREVADRVIMMDKGRIIEDRAPKDFFDAPEHPRSREFLARIR